MAYIWYRKTWKRRQEKNVAQYIKNSVYNPTIHLLTIPNNMSKKPVLVIIQIVYLLSVSCLLKNNDNVILSKSSWHWNRHQLCSFIQTRITWLPITTICGRLIASEPIVLNTSWSLLITGISPSISNITLHSIWFWSVRFS